MAPEPEPGARAGRRARPAARVAVRIEAPDWRRALPQAVRLARRAVEAGLAGAGAPPGAEVGVILTDDERIRPLNRDWRGRDRATDVLSFPALEPEEIARLRTAPADGPPRLLGDVIVAYGTAAGDAARDGKALGDHLAHLLIHGTLHLLGYDHETGEADARRMEALEAQILAGLGIADPYAMAGAS